MSLLLQRGRSWKPPGLPLRHWVLFGLADSDDGSAQLKTEAAEPVSASRGLSSFPGTMVGDAAPQPRVSDLFHSLVGQPMWAPEPDLCPHCQVLPGEGPTPSRLVFLGIRTPDPFGCSFLLSASQAAGVLPFGLRTAPARRALVVTILQMRKRRPRAAQGLAWSHGA